MSAPAINIYTLALAAMEEHQPDEESQTQHPNVDSLCETMDYTMDYTNFDSDDEQVVTMASERIEEGKSADIHCPSSALFSRCATPATEGLTDSFEHIWTSLDYGSEGEEELWEQPDKELGLEVVEKVLGSVNNTRSIPITTMLGRQENSKPRSSDMEAVPSPGLLAMQSESPSFGFFDGVLDKPNIVVAGEEASDCSSIPVVEEEDKAPAPTTTAPEKTCHKDPRYRCGAAILVLFYVLSMVFSFFVLPSLQGRQADDNIPMQHHWQPVAAFATVAPTSVREFAIQAKVAKVVDSSLLFNVTTPHGRALEWILHQDTLQLSASTSNLLQRYAMALFYFSTSVSGPWRSCNPPSEADKYNKTCETMHVLPGNKPVTVMSPLPHNSWLSHGVQECDWAGVNCDDWGSVVELHLNGMGLSGFLPQDIGLLLPNLQAVFLAHNDLSGELPVAWATDMKQLGRIQLHYNQLTGPIPPEWMSMKNAEQINLASNLLSGTIPAQVGMLGSSATKTSYSPRLALFLFSNPMLTGTIPSEIGHLERLAYLRLSRTSLSGSIPSEMGRLTVLEEFWAGRTQLSGSIASSLGGLSALRDLRLQHTSISGSLPEELYDLPLDRLDLWQAQLQGTISPKIAQLSSSLSVLRLHNNTLTGPIPSELGLLSNLETLYLHNNHLQGAVPTQVCGAETIHSIGGVSIDVGADCLVSNASDAPAVTCDCCMVCCDASTEFCMYMDL